MNQTEMEMTSPCDGGSTSRGVGEIRDKAEEAEPDMFKQWSPKGVSSHLKRYGLKTNKSAGRKVYGRVTPDDLRKIQTAYAVDLGFAEEQAPT